MLVVLQCAVFLPKASRDDALGHGRHGLWFRKRRSPNRPNLHGDVCVGKVPQSVFLWLCLTGRLFAVCPRSHHRIRCAVLSFDDRILILDGSLSAASVKP